MIDSPIKVLPVDTSRLQLEISQKFLSNSTFDSLYRSKNLSTQVEKPSEMMSRRLKQHKHPLSGISVLIPEMLTNPDMDPDSILKEIKGSQKLNSRILETWLNNTVTDAADLGLPESIVKQDAKVPLVRFGIDRTTLISSGLQSSEVDRIYRALFVYSIGFFQLVRKVLQHTRNKYTIITGIWKVFAILLEYCCQFDYEMIVTTLNVEKQEELENLERDYKEKILKMEEHEKSVVDSFNMSRLQLQQLQKDLMDEIQKREELEDELLQRGSGHEEEVTMRLQFESKLNQMYAKLRDMESKLGLLNESLEEVQGSLETRTQALQEERQKNLTLMQYKLETEQEMKRVIEKSKQIESVNSNIEQRLVECYNKIDEVNQALSNANTQYNQSLNDLAHQKIEIEDLKFSIEIFKGHINKLTTVIDENKAERAVHVARIKSLEATLAEETSRNKHFQQEYVKIKEHDIVKTLDLVKYKKRTEELEVAFAEVEKERDSLKIHKESLEGSVNEFRSQLKESKEKLEEMNKGRRIVEELNHTLKSRIEDRDKEILECRGTIMSLKEDIEKFKTNETEIQASLATVNIKLHSVEKQFETTKSTLQDKINNLNEILESEKSVRQNWIYRYEEEQKVLANVTRQLIETQDRLNEATIKNNNLNATLEQNHDVIQKLVEKNKQDLGENLELRVLNEDLARKLKTTEILLQRVDEDYQERVKETYQRVEKLKEQKNEEINSALMATEETWAIALNNLQSLNSLVDEHVKVMETQARIDEIIGGIKTELYMWSELSEQRGMLLEEARDFIITSDIQYSTSKNNVKILEFDLRKLKKDFLDFRNLAPPDLRNSANPFRVLQKQLTTLKKELEHVENSKLEKFDFDMQFDSARPVVFDIDTQTESHERYSSENNERDSRGHSSSVSLIEEESMKQEVSPKRRVNESYDFSHNKILEKGKRTLREKYHPPEDDQLTPFNMKSIYNNEQTVDTVDSSIQNNSRLPVIYRKTNQPSSLVQLPKGTQPSPLVHLPQPIPTANEFKRFLKQAVNRK